MLSLQEELEDNFTIEYCEDNEITHMIEGDKCKSHDKAIKNLIEKLEGKETLPLSQLIIPTVLNDRDGGYTAIINISR